MLNNSIKSSMIALFVFFIPQANANALLDHGWQLNSQHSNVSFATLKKENITENNHFKMVKGQIKNGQAQIVLDSKSVETMIPIRNERLQKYVLQTEKYPQITIQADLGSIKNTKNIQLTDWTLPATLSIAGAKKDIQLKVQIHELNDGKVAVNSIMPVIVAAKDFALSDGIIKLSELVGGIHISQTVPVSFNLVFQPNI